MWMDPKENKFILLIEYLPTKNEKKIPRQNSHNPYPQQNWNKPQFTPSLIIQMYSLFSSYTYIYYIPCTILGAIGGKQPPRRLVVRST